MSNERLVSINMTNFFNRELFMYSLGDIRFKKPVSLKKVAYTTAFLIIWTLPLVLIFGVQINVFFAALALGPPLFFGNVASKPRWGGKTLIDAIKTTVKFIGEPKGWTDLKASKDLDEGELFVENEIWISRRRELQILADIKEERLNRGVK
jgi:hypothetical protein